MEKYDRLIRELEGLREVLRANHRPVSLTPTQRVWLRGLEPRNMPESNAAALDEGEILAGDLRREPEGTPGDYKEMEDWREGREV